MTRRERHIRIIESHGLDSQSGRYHFQQLLSRRKLGALTDAAVEELARDLVDGHKRQQRYNREARERRAKVAS